MTYQSDVLNDPNYTPVLDKGFVGFVDKMGDDHSIVQAARVSYGKGTKSVREDRGLIRYLMRNRHTSPFEMIETKWHIKLPIFVMRQLVRHRTASLNEYSARYSVMTEEFYIPNKQDIQPQSTNNKQGRGGNLTEQEKEAVQFLIETNDQYGLYKMLLGEDHEIENSGTGLDENFPGIARELARMVLPVNIYTECYWKVNLHNLFHFLSLRADSHAQKEIRDYANVMFDYAKEYFPVSTEAFEDYVLYGKNFSRMEMEFLRSMVNPDTLDVDYLKDNFDLSKGEAREFIAKIQG